MSYESQEEHDHFEGAMEQSIPQKCSQDYGNRKHSLKRIADHTQIEDVLVKAKLK